MTAPSFPTPAERLAEYWRLVNLKQATRNPASYTYQQPPNFHKIRPGNLLGHAPTIQSQLTVNNHHQGQSYGQQALGGSFNFGMPTLMPEVFPSNQQLWDNGRPASDALPDLNFTTFESLELEPELTAFYSAPILTENTYTPSQPSSSSTLPTTIDLTRDEGPITIDLTQDDDSDAPATTNNHHSIPTSASDPPVTTRRVRQPKKTAGDWALASIKFNPNTQQQVRGSSKFTLEQLKRWEEKALAPELYDAAKAVAQQDAAKKRAAAESAGKKRKAEEDAAAEVQAEKRRKCTEVAEERKKALKEKKQAHAKRREEQQQALEEERKKRMEDDVRFADFTTGTNDGLDELFEGDLEIDEQPQTGSGALPEDRTSEKEDASQTCEEQQLDDQLAGEIMAHLEADWEKEHGQNAQQDPSQANYQEEVESEVEEEMEDEVGEEVEDNLEDESKDDTDLELIAELEVTVGDTWEREKKQKELAAANETAEQETSDKSSEGEEECEAWEEDKELEESEEESEEE